MPTVRTVTLGCKVNQYETEYVRQGLLRAGYREVRGDEPADLCIVNTCTVTLEGDYKSRKLIRQLARDNPGTEIVAMGCYATRAAGEVAALPGVVEVLTDKRQLPELLARFGLVHAPRGISSFGRMHRAYVKVQDGCAMQCSYCIVPKVRPNVWSRPVEDILEEIRQLVHHGHREIILTGIHLGHYGVGLPGAGEGADTARSKETALRSANCHSERSEEAICHSERSEESAQVSEILRCAQDDSRHAQDNTTDLPCCDIVGSGHTRRVDLAVLLSRILSLSGTFRVRLSSLEASEATPEIVHLMAAHPDRVCPHLHLSMQSGSDAVLARMRRPWPVARFLDRCREIRRILDQPALTTDVIVGFPGETDEDFEATCRAAEEAFFAKIHVFPFSCREGTPAALMPDQVPFEIKHRRAERLTQIGRRLAQRYCESLLGRRLQILVESPLPGSSGAYVGTAARYVQVEVPEGGHRLNELVYVVAREVIQGRIRA